MAESEFFSDDDLDRIPDNTLLELEQHAISSTQKPQYARPAPLPRYQRPKQAHNATSLNRGRTVNPNIPWRPPQLRTQVSHDAQPQPEVLSQQYPFDDESVINLADDTALSGWSQSQAPVQKPAYRQKEPLDPETAAAFAAADAELAAQRKSTRPQSRPISNHAEDAALQRRIAQLEAEAVRARDGETQMRRALEAKTGEITIVRANAEKERKEHDRRIQAMQKNYAEEAAKHKQELEANKKEREKMRTDNRFLQHDLAQEADRAKRYTVQNKSRTAGGVKESPRKTRRNGLGDGFDDDEVRRYSPSRSKEKDATPKNGVKRKRDAKDSPVQMLSFSELEQPLHREDSTDNAIKTRREDSHGQPLSRHESFPSRADSREGALRSRDEEDEDSEYDAEDSDDVVFMQSLLEYEPQDHTTPLLEVLANLRIPPDHRSLSTHLLASLSSTGSDGTTPQQVIRSMASLWAQCVEQQHFENLALVVEIIQFAMASELPSNLGCLAEQLVPLCLHTLELVTIPVVRAHMRTLYASVEDVVTDMGPSHIDPDQVTAVLEELCEGCTLSSDHTQTFWRTIDFQSSLLLLHKALPLERVMSGLRILYTSALDESFGAINNDDEHQAQQEKDTVLRLTFAFSEIPTVPVDEVPYDDLEILEFRLLVLDIFRKLCESDHGSRLLACHQHFIGRLVKFIDEQLRKLYLLPPQCLRAEHTAGPRNDGNGDVIMVDEDPALDTATDRSEDEHEMVVKAINLSIRILQFLMEKHQDLVNLADKFAVVTGGYHSFLIGMTRLAFVEQPALYEYGIAEDVIDAAHSILDAVLTPEDGEAVAQALETPQGSRGQSAPKSQGRGGHYDAMDVDVDALEAPG